MGNPRYIPPGRTDEPAVRVATTEAMRAAHTEYMRAQKDAHIIIVCGGRAYFDRERVFAALDKAHAKRRITLLVHGGAPGADTLAGEWAKERGVWVQVFEADWKGLGPKAGPLRNAEMVASGAHGCVAFPGGPGTEDCVRKCQAAGIPVWKPFG